MSDQRSLVPSDDPAHDAAHVPALRPPGEVQAAGDAASGVTDATVLAEATLSCRNCGHVLRPDDHYCAQCGQDTHAEPPSFLEFVHEFSHHYVAVEGALWKTLWLLLVRPGQLTLEYLAGRKNRYVWPLRLFLTLSFVFFLSWKFAGPSSLPHEGVVAASAGSAPMVQASAARPAASDASRALHVEAGDGLKDDSLVAEGRTITDQLASWAEQEKRRHDRWQAARAASAAKAGASVAREPFHIPARSDQAFLQQRIDRFNERLDAAPRAAVTEVVNAFSASLPTAILAMLPFFAGLLALVYWARKLPYGAHFVFTLHLHAFYYLCLLLLLLSPWTILGVAIWAWSNLYTLLALKRVYGGGWFSTLLRAGVIAVSHWVLLGLVLTVDFLLVALH